LRGLNAGTEYNEIGAVFPVLSSLIDHSARNSTAVANLLSLSLFLLKINFPSVLAHSGPAIQYFMYLRHHITSSAKHEFKCLPFRNGEATGDLENAVSINYDRRSTLPVQRGIALDSLWLSQQHNCLG
jgi:hypothetical protein